MSDGISILVPTYGRTQVLGEVIESYLRQEGSTPREMIVLNDHPEQNITLDPSAYRPESPITIVNAGKRFADLGTKRNALVGMAALPWVWFWDDDDVYLPHALRRMAGLIQAQPQTGQWRCVRESHCWQVQAVGAHPGVGAAVPWPGGLELIVRDAGPMWSMAVQRSAIEQLGGFAPIDRKQDVDLANRLVRSGWLRGSANTPGIPSCIHRLAGTRYVHAIEYTGPVDNAQSSAFHATATSALMDMGEEPRGEVCINPIWHLDYTGLTQAAWINEHADRTVPRYGEPES